MSIDWSKAPEGATHYCKPHGMWHKAAYNPFRVWVWMQDAQDWELQPKERTDFWFNQGDLSEHDLLERPKTLTQAVFDGLPPEYRWAAVWRTGKAVCFADRVNLCTYGYDSVTLLGCKTRLFIGDGYDTTDWQNSLIERQDVSSRVERLRSVEAARQVEKDAVNNPSHYTTGGIECIDAMQAMLSREEFIGYLRGNVFKYQWRYQHKNGIEDLKKAQWYANRLIELESGK